MYFIMTVFKGLRKS